MSGLENITDILLYVAMSVAWMASVLGLYGRHRDLPAFFTGPQICKLEGHGCQVLFRTKDAAVLGPPNSLLGLLFFSALPIALFLEIKIWILFIASAFSLLMTFYLGYLLISQKLECRICWTGHFANATVWLMLLLKMVGL